VKFFVQPFGTWSGHSACIAKTEPENVDFTGEFVCNRLEVRQKSLT